LGKAHGVGRPISGPEIAFLAKQGDRKPGRRITAQTQSVS
jgi:hypothetical protein